MDQPSPAAPAAAPAAVGETLRSARERQGVALAEIASRTRIPLRHLQAIEIGDYSGLPSNTYATGFVKAYARAVGVDEVAITRQLRGELARLGPRTPDFQPYEPPDPARVPSRGLAIVTAGLALALIVLVGLWYGSGLFRRGAAPASVATGADAAEGARVVRPRPAAAPTAIPATGGQVTLTTTDRVWLRVHDGAKTLYLGTMAPGDHFDVPATAVDPLVDIGRPDKLRVALNGSALPALPASSQPLKDLRIGAAAVAARQAGAVASQAATPAETLGTPAASAGQVPSGPTPPRRVLSETQRANLQSARQLPAPTATP
ncbi:helix-turn-helix domain-containing protein [uncultured Sphingomonas sp.]|uniref:helix-turn-helix domain-containing protein n=1 Tax=uncultured Sphingomonas sp. TaxID=158754 RepID=UPI0035CA2467